MEVQQIDIRLDFNSMKIDLVKAIHACAQRGLYHSVKWLSEINFSLKHIQLSKEDTVDISDDLDEEVDAYLLAKSYFDLKEYDRCSHFVKDCMKPKSRFLYFYSKYLSIEKKKIEDNMIDTNSSHDPNKNETLVDLYTTLKIECFENRLDGYCLYLYGVILKKLDLVSVAIEVFIKSVIAEPMLWSAWFELGKIIPDKNFIFSVALPEHWIKSFFLAHTFLEQLNNDESLQMYNTFFSLGFQNNTYVLSQIALGHHNRRNLNDAIEIFQRILEIDPYRLDNLDTYSNLLYVLEMKKELADLAHKVVNIDKYRVETCCVIGNYYSLRSDHTKAVLYFRRALKLNPQFLSAWTLMGHEFMEMKNTNAAIQSYRHAIEINSRDYRAWYGLGQTYEILKMPNYCLHYYKRAQQLKPNDSRMVIALGEAYEKLDKTENALKCYYKACNLGDVEGTALLKLAKLYDKLVLVDSAADAFTEFCLREEDRELRCVDDQTEFYNALQYLANYHLKKGELDDAYTYAYKCMECEETKEQGKALLKTIAAKRAEQEAAPPRMSESSTSHMDMIFSPNP
ncbi:cell division cycle protein 23 homolog [Diabrotica virgifera virgifera]|uniref:Cell division cycle protein 23 homolog n=1 Tax=Diabrotica virgifera virgifera TaxID=50390 RepID=A0A6P7GYC1_DIAVI|nr:cell division cycle protein 23 homolog [Diabrotica virgifera virgifera]